LPLPSFFIFANPRSGLQNGKLVSNAARLAVAIGEKMFAIWTRRITVVICIPVLISLAVPVFIALSISRSVRVATSGVVRLRYRSCRLRRRTSGN
jgi:hypothetical protein